MNRIQRAGKLFQENTESRGTIRGKYGEQGSYVSKIRRSGGLFEENRESRKAI